MDRARLIRSLRGSTNVERMPPIYGTQFGDYDPAEDVTYRSDEPETFAQAAGLDPLNKTLPYVDPNADYWSAIDLAGYEADSARLDEMMKRGELDTNQPPMLDKEELDELIRQSQLPKTDQPASDLPPLDPEMVARLSARLNMQELPRDLHAEWQARELERLRRDRGRMSPPAPGPSSR